MDNGRSIHGEEKVGWNRHQCCGLCSMSLCFWSSLSMKPLVLPPSQLYSFSLPNHWMKDFFLAAGSLELMLLMDALAYYTHLRKIGFTSSSYINSQVALIHYHSKGWNVVDYKHTHTHAHTNTCTQTHTHTHIHTNTNTYTHTHTRLEFIATT